MTISMHQTTLETTGGVVEVSLHLNKETHEVIKCRCKLQGEPDVLELTPAYFWAILDADAREIYDNAVTELQNTALA